MTEKSSKVTFNLSNPVHWLALGFGSGLLKPAPGTWGTLSAIPLYLLVVHLGWHGLIEFSLLISAMFVLGIYLCGKTSRDVGVDDHSAIVWDEFVGLFITFYAVPPTLSNIVLGFLLFRLFDILKPWPISIADRSLHGGFGIMLDDVLAGILACLALHAVINFI